MANQELGTIHVTLRIFETKYQSDDRKQKVSVPLKLDAKVTIDTTEGSSNWDGEHSIGFVTKPPGSFSDSDKTRGRFTRRLREVAIKQMPDHGVFTHESPSSPAQPSK